MRQRLRPNYLRLRPNTWDWRWDRTTWDWDHCKLALRPNVPGVCTVRASAHVNRIQKRWLHTTSLCSSFSSSRMVASRFFCSKVCDFQYNHCSDWLGPDISTIICSTVPCTNHYTFLICHIPLQKHQLTCILQPGADCWPDPFLRITLLPGCSLQCTDCQPAVVCHAVSAFCTMLMTASVYRYSHYARLFWSGTHKIAHI